MSNSKLLVVAMDFGTTYSGYAFSLLQDFQTDPLKIFANTVWNAGGQSLMSLKTPTVLLVDPKGQNLFGYEAQNKYIDLTVDKDKSKHKQVYYFSLFKMKLHGDQALTSDLMLEDETGKSMKALDVFGLSIKLLKTHLENTLATNGIQVNNGEITWVLTVPAIWSDSAKQFMRQAADAAGISDNDLMIALEPEAASLFCQHLPTEKLVDSRGARFSVAKTGTKYMVVDIGGGTVDITVHEKLDGSKLKELTKASGGAYGGSVVNNELFSFWTKLVGGPTVNEFRSYHKEDYINMYREFEVTKRDVDPTTDTKTTMKIPAILNEICKKRNGQTIGEIVEESNNPFKGELECISDKLRVSPDRMRKMFQPAIKGIVTLIQDILMKPETKGVNLMLLVGGFAESVLVQNAIKTKFATPSMKVVVPQEAGLAVLKGAVIFGHSPHSIRSRVTRYTYGVKLTPSFDPDKHPSCKKVMVDKKACCTDVFDPFMRAGTSIEIGTRVIKAYSTARPNQTGISISVFTSLSESPKFTTDEGCKCIGKLQVQVPCPTEKLQPILVAFCFGDTEVKMIGFLKGDKPCVTSFKLE